MRLIYEKQAVIDDVISMQRLTTFLTTTNARLSFVASVIKCYGNLTSWKVSLRSDSFAKEPS